MNAELGRVGESRMEEGVRLRPFTTLALFLFAAVFVGGLVAVFVFADTKEERWLRSLISLGADVVAILAFTAVVRREESAPFPLLARKTLWLCIVLFVVGAFAFTIYALFAPVPGFHPGVSLAVLAPGAVIAWKLFRNERRG